MGFSEIMQFLVSGITVGGTYALIAVGFVVIYNVTGVLNFAQGEFAMLGALTMASMNKLGLPFAAGFLATVAIVTLVGAALERLAIHPARKARSILTLIMITLGADILLRGAALLIWGAEPYALPAFTPGPAVKLLGAVVVRQSFWIVGISLAMVSALFVFFNRTMVGTALRACVINRLASRLMGISPERMSLFSFSLSAALGAVAGIAMAPVTLATYDMGLMLGVKGFVAAVLGGLTRAPAAVVGGFVLGILESMGAGLISSAYKDAIAFFILLLVLFLKPSGILGGLSGKRV